VALYQMCRPDRSISTAGGAGGAGGRVPRHTDHRTVERSQRMHRFRTLLSVAVAGVLLASSAPAHAAAPPPAGPIRIGYCGGDDWEPAFAARGQFVYTAITHYVGDPTCDPASANPAAIYLQTSADGGRTFAAATPVFTGPIGGVTYTAQADPTVAVDAAGNVYVAFLDYGVNGGHTDVVVAKSTDNGATFPTAVKINTKDCKNCDHEKIIATSGGIYVAFSQASSHFLSRSADAGATWTQSMVLSADVVAFAESMVADAAGNVYTAWGDCQSSNCTGSPAADYRVSRTVAGTLTTTFAAVATGVQGPDCPYSSCGFAYFGNQDGLAIDGNGTLYLAWQQGQSSTTRKSPPIINLSRSTDGGRTWTLVGRADDKNATGCAASACYALYPTLVGGPGSTLYLAWMDDRAGSPIDHTNGWNVWLRQSTTGGTSWTGPSTRMSAYDPAQEQSQPAGFDFPYGDYLGLALNSCGAPMLTWGEGVSWVGGPSAPGHIQFRTLC
jgi:hypothetical protein